MAERCYATRDGFRCLLVAHPDNVPHCATGPSPGWNYWGGRCAKCGRPAEDAHERTEGAHVTDHLGEFATILSEARSWQDLERALWKLYGHLRSTTTAPARTEEKPAPRKFNCFLCGDSGLHPMTRDPCEGEDGTGCKAPSDAEVSEEPSDDDSTELGDGSKFRPFLLQAGTLLGLVAQKFSDSEQREVASFLAGVFAAGNSSAARELGEAKEILALALSEYYESEGNWTSRAQKLLGRPVQPTCTTLMLRAEKAESELAELREKYNELLLQVGNVYEGETRHETALRYLRSCENQTGVGAAVAIPQNLRPGEGDG